MAQVNLGHVVGPGVPTGGTANQVLVKNGSSNFDTSWKDAGTIPAIANVQDGLAIVANGNTHAAIASGQFVYVKNHGSLAEGLYRATEAIGTNATLSTSNLTADSAGGLNALKADVDTLNSKLLDESGTPIPTYPDADVTAQEAIPCLYVRNLNSVSIKVSIKISNAQTGYANRKVVDLNLPNNIKPPYSMDAVIGNGEGDGFTFVTLGSDGKLTIYPQKTGTTYASGIITYVF